MQCTSSVEHTWGEEKGIDGLNVSQNDVQEVKTDLIQHTPAWKKIPIPMLFNYLNCI